MIKTFKYRLFPTKAQRTKLNQTLEICRLVYNRTLAIRKESWEQSRKSISLFDTNKMLTAWKKEQPEFIEVHSQVLQNTQGRVDLAFQAFFRRVKAGNEPGYPRFKSYNRYDSFTYPQGGFGLDDNGRLYLSKIGYVKIKLHRPLEGEVKTLTVRRDSVGNWYACFSCIIEPQPLPPSIEVVGVDLGLTTFAMLSNGEKIKRQRWAKRDERDIARLQRQKERLPKSSPERRKAVHALCRAYQRQTNRRNNFAHQETRKLVNRYGLIVFEDLDIDGMQANGNRTINKGIADVAWSRFVTLTEAKAEEAARSVIRVNPKNTSQMCSGCGEIVKKDLSVRVHSCPHCGLVLDRDLNAARNILSLGLQALSLGSGSPRIHTGE